MDEIAVPNPTNSIHREGLVEQVRDMVEAKYPGDWNDRCYDVACHTVFVLKGYGLTGYRIAAGRVEESGTDPVVVLFAGVYTDSGKSQYHTWVVGPDGERLDFSVVPTRYGTEYLWEPHVTAPQLNYVEITATTETVKERLGKKYGGACS